MKGTKKLAAALLAAAMMMNCAAITSSAAKVKYITYKGTKIARLKSDGKAYYIDQKDPKQNSRALNALMKGSTERTVVLPQGDLKLSTGIDFGSNKTLIASGTNVIQTDPQKQLVKNPCTKTNYNSLKNVTIDGGTWYITDNEKMLRDTSTIRFNHGQNITIKNCTVYTNYRSHGIEIIACRDVDILNCTVKCEGTPVDGRREEAVQIDIATAKTAPTCKDDSGKFVAGQTCRNITIDGCTITGARALVCNRTDSENNKWRNNMHHNIVVKNCKLTGVTAEGLVLNNVQGFDVINNTIISKNKDTSTNFSAGLSAMLFGQDKDGGTYKNHIRGNTIKGGKMALLMTAYSGVSATYGSTSIKNNKLYCRKGANYAMTARNISKLSKPGNTTYKWN